MFIIKKTITFIFIILLMGCTKNVNMYPLLPINNYLLVATNFDTSIDGARSKALSLLAQNIFVQVNSNFSANEKLDINGNFTSNVINQINLNSNGYFKDLEYSIPENVGKGQYKVSVGLNTKSLINTIIYLNKGLKSDLIDTLSNYDLKEELNKANFLISLVMYANTQSVSVPKINLNNIIKYKNDLSLRISNVSQISFNILPNLNNISKININNKDYNATEKIFLPQGTYYYTVYAKGYKTITNRIDIPCKDKIFINLYLQKLLSSPINVKLNLTSENADLSILSLKSQISTLIEKYQLKATDLTTNILSIHFLPTNYNLINNYYYFTLPVEISLIKNDTQNLSKNFTITYVSSKANGNISSHVIIQKIDEFLEELTADNNLQTVYK